MMRSHLIPVRMAIIKKKKTRAKKAVATLEPLHAVGEDAKWYSCCGEII